MNIIVDTMKYGIILCTFEIFALVISSYHITLEQSKTLQDALANFITMAIRFYLINVVGLIILTYI